MAIEATRPLSSQVEIVLFGPGYGESILIHLGSNKWVIIDSCIEPGKSNSAALDYLSSINVDPSQSVVLIIATHWHDDHIRGLAQIVEMCEQAIFSCSIAFTKTEFASAVSRYNKHNNTICGSGAKEIYEIYHLLEKRSPKLAVANTRIFSLRSEDLPHKHPVSIWALSPSAQQVDRFLLDLSKLMPKLSETKRRATAPSPNHNSMVNLIEIGPLGILLGADLEEEKGQSGLGWSAILDNLDNQHNKSMIFKVAHHGSETAHHESIWKDLLVENPYALVTPWNRSTGLPLEVDVNRIASLTNNGYLTSVPKQLASSVKRDPVVAKMIKEITGGKLRRPEAAFGIIRMRSVNDKLDEWKVELSDTAKSLNQLKTA